MALEGLGWLSLVFFIIMPIFQILKTIRTKKVDDVSPAMWLCYAAALSSQGVYLALQDKILWPALMNQVASLGLAIFQLFLIGRYRVKTPA